MMSSEDHALHATRPQSGDVIHPLLWRGSGYETLKVLVVLNENSNNLRETDGLEEIPS